jgi:hypothetical protein
MKTVWFIAFVLSCLVFIVGSTALTFLYVGNIILKKRPWLQEFGIVVISSLFLPIAIFLTTRQFDIDLFVALVIAAFLSALVDLLMTAAVGGEKSAAMRSIMALDLEGQMRRNARFSAVQLLTIVGVIVGFLSIVGYEYFSNQIPSAHATDIISDTIIGSWVLSALF